MKRSVHVHIKTDTTCLSVEELVYYLTLDRDVPWETLGSIAPLVCVCDNEAAAII